MKYKIPVTYLCVDEIEVEASSLEEAVCFVKQPTPEVEQNMVSLNASYINKSVCIDDNRNGTSSTQELIQFLKQYN